MQVASRTIGIPGVKAAKVVGSWFSMELRLNVDSTSAQFRESVQWFEAYEYSSSPWPRVVDEMHAAIVRKCLDHYRVHPWEHLFMQLLEHIIERRKGNEATDRFGT